MRNALIKVKRGWALLGLLLLMISPALSQPMPGGVIIEGNPHGTGILNPLFCDNPTCERITSLLFPTLFGTGDGLVEDWEVSADGMIYTLTLKPGMTWSDDRPITPDDVLFSYNVAADPHAGSRYHAQLADTVKSIEINGNQVVFTLAQPSCDAPTSLNLPIIPVHRYPGIHPRDVRNQAESYRPTVTGGAFQFEPGRVEDEGEYRLIRGQDSTYPDAYVFIDTFGIDDTVDRFINGETNFIFNPPVNRWDDIRAMKNVQMTQLPGSTFDYIAFNVADPIHPRPYNDPEGQGDHPVFADPRVREAVRLAIDVEALIEAALEGNGQAIAINQAPVSWAFDPNLRPKAYDPRAAERLLEDAGWKDANRDGVRECIGCQFASEGQSLAFRLSINSSIPRHQINAALISEQLRNVGFSVDFSSGEVIHQQFDAYLTTYEGGVPYRADMRTWLEAAEDLPGSGANITSYTNPELERRLMDGAVLPGCDRDQRAKLYNEEAVQEILMGDAPYVWLYAPDELYASTGEAVRFVSLSDLE